ncbi:MAG TPA: tRNA (guanosine(46)-N7)-methyltransferase TrmB [Spongiibacteraceae bacterium]|nr:tRNA (guanosine(46)-N7)-methyltransferase TrmB [Spongiibacteraceae bacterium]
MSIKTVSDSAEAKNSVQHRIRSFVLRQGRMTAAQESGLELLPQKGLFREHGLLDCEKAFGRSAPTVLEIGFGMGASLLQMAQAASDKNFIGIEVHRPGVGKLLHDMADAGVDNIRVYCDDAVEVLQHCIADDSLDAVQIFFPDPWHKKRHHKRRLIQPEFVELLHRKLKTGGVLHAATDWQDYAEHILAVMQAAPNFRNCAINDYALRPDYRPKTKFEQRGERLGHGVWDIMFAKI